MPVARWLGERLREPYRYKYITGPRDTKMQNTHARAPPLGNAESATAWGAYHGGLLQWAGEESVEDSDYFWVKQSSGGGGLLGHV